MTKLCMENPDNLWVRLENGVYTTPIFIEGTPNPLFNFLPNSAYLTNGKKLKYWGFIEGCSEKTKFESEVLLVIIHGTAIVNRNIELITRNAIFSDEIFCHKGSIVLVFKPCYIDEQINLLKHTEMLTSNEYITKYRVYGISLGGNVFFETWSGLDYTFHAFTQESKKNVARGAHARCFYQKTLILHKGKIHMKTYYPNDSIIIDTKINKTKDYYEGYYISGHCYHSFKALENSIDTIIVERNYGIPMEVYPLKALFTEKDLICSERDGVNPTSEQIKRLGQANILKI